MNDSLNFSKIFDKYAENYSDFIIKYTVKRRYETVSKLLKGDVLELGSANGQILNYKSQYRSILLTDISNKMCEIIKKIHNKKALCINVDSFDISPKKFDSIVALDVLCYSKNLNSCIQNIKNHLKPEGTVFISTFNPKMKFLLQVRKFLNRYTNFKHLWIDEHIPNSYEYLNVTKLKAALNEHNLKIIQIYYVAPLPLESLHILNVAFEKTFLKYLSSNIIFEIAQNY
jgi:2-polyprenyl-3-methyl-5-hydroxy-6-metoxy-1,4-benzoquinol methylase